ncbi:31480_t:CDS:2, partial [Gigaspora margarita]
DLNDKENQVIVFKDTHYTSSRFTPDQRRALLFNVNQSFEVQEQDFDKEWYPLSQIFGQGACNKVVMLDVKKQLDTENMAFEFHTKQISAFGVGSEILEQIHKFPFPIQQLIVSEVYTMQKAYKKYEKLLKNADTRASGSNENKNNIKPH